MSIQPLTSINVNLSKDGKHNFENNISTSLTVAKNLTCQTGLVGNFWFGSLQIQYLTRGCKTSVKQILSMCMRHHSLKKLVTS